MYLLQEKGSEELGSYLQRDLNRERHSRLDRLSFEVSEYLCLEWIQGGHYDPLGALEDLQLSAVVLSLVEEAAAAAHLSEEVGM